ncbi:RNA methyltransferase [Desulfovibrio sp. OttesenSCG-928-C06]|nr:RNA methyltransferase [Desulfovibrio sp. OttesenSCG-928-C06]
MKNNQNPKAYKDRADKTDRAPEQESILPGLKPVRELLESTPEQVDCVYVRKGRRDKNTDAILDLCRDAGVRFKLVEDQALSSLYSGNCQGVLARLFPSGFADYDELLAQTADAPLPLLVALDQVVDPGNAGTLIRSLYAMGGAGLIVTKHQGAFLGGAAAKAAAGAMRKLPIAKVTNLAQALDKAADQGFRIYGAATGEESVSAFDFTPELPAILVLGSEESGIRQGILKRCDARLQIPLRREFDSLNVAQAGAMLLALFSQKIS